MQDQSLAKAGFKCFNRNLRFQLGKYTNSFQRLALSAALGQHSSNV
jgi:hypothetical protein